MVHFRFGTAINCIDGRTQEPVIDFMKQKYNIDGVSMHKLLDSMSMIKNR